MGIMTMQAAGVAVVHVVETNVLGVYAHYWDCQVCGDQSRRVDGSAGRPRKVVTEGATRHASRHTDAQDRLDEKASAHVEVERSSSPRTP